MGNNLGSQGEAEAALPAAQEASMEIDESPRENQAKRKFQTFPPAAPSATTTTTATTSSSETGGDETRPPRQPQQTGEEDSALIDEAAMGDVTTQQPPDPEDDYVPTVFRWEHGGRQVYVTGTFNDWQRQIPMHRSGNDFTYIHNLKKGKHAFKFIVDDEWRFAPDQPTVADVEGRINNFIDVSDFDAYVGDEQFLLKRDKSVANDLYARDIPDLDEYTKDPQPLPPHLRHIILNKAPPQGDASALPVPQHVALNHLYCTAIKDGMMVLGVTLRYKQKHCTTVYYSVS